MLHFTSEASQRTFGRKLVSRSSDSRRLTFELRQKTMKKTDTGFNISIPTYSPTARQSFTWVGNDVGESTLALLKNYTDSSKNISGKAYPVVTANMTFPELATTISKGQRRQTLQSNIIYI